MLVAVAGAEGLASTSLSSFLDSPSLTALSLLVEGASEKDKPEPGLPPPRTRCGGGNANPFFFGAGSIESNDEDPPPPPSLGFFAAGRSFSSSLPLLLPSIFGSVTTIFFGFGAAGFLPFAFAFVLAAFGGGSDKLLLEDFES